MRYLAAILLALGAAIVVVAPPRRRMVERIRTYLTPVQEERNVATARRTIRVSRGILWMAIGAFVGLLVAQGDLFLSGPGRSVPALVALGGAAGWFAFSAHRSTIAERRSRRFRFELPVITDTLALQIVSGESVATSIANVSRDIKGVAAEELSAVLGRLEEGMALPESLIVAARATAHPDGARLYEVLAHAHTVGGRLGVALSELATDFRAALERDITAEGGRKAITAYGPVLALMVPTALAFLLYPTLLGLRALSGAP